MTKVAVLGASGYSGAELMRLLLRHPYFDCVQLAAERNANQPVAALFPQLAHAQLPDLVATRDVDFRNIDIMFCCLPHGTTQTIIGQALDSHPQLKVVDLSADFRLNDAWLYQRWYGDAHQRPDLQAEAVYGLTEIHRQAIQATRLVANPGCYTTTALLPLIPLLKARVIKPEGLIVDAKSGVTGAGRALKPNLLFTEINEGFSAYAIAAHRHTAELDQELALVAERAVQVSFTPHLLPVQRGIYATIYAELSHGVNIGHAREALEIAYGRERFVHLLPEGQVPSLQHVTGSNNLHIGVFGDRFSHRLIIISALDNLIKGAAGQALQNANLVCGFKETLGLEGSALFP